MWQSSATGFTLQNFPSGSPQSQVENVSSLRSHICLWWTMKGRPLQHGTRHQPLTGDPGTTFSPVFVLYLVGYGTKDGPSPSSPILWYAIDSIAASASILFFVNMDCEYYVDLLDLRIWSGRRLHVSGSLCTHKSHAYFQKGFQRSDQILRNSQYTHTHTHLIPQIPIIEVQLKLTSSSKWPFPIPERPCKCPPVPSTRAFNAWLFCHRLTTSLLSHALPRSECL